MRTPSLDTDPFSPDVLADPYPFHEQVREAGPVVRLDRYGIWVIGGHQNVDATLRDWPAFTSATGVGLANFRTEKPWRPPSLLLENDPPGRTKYRAVLLLLAAANRDPRRWPEPDRFDITRRTSGHLGLGVGVHACVGQAVARLETELVLAALARRVGRVELAGPLEREPNNTLRGFARLPVIVHPG
ncbi:MAG TPA: cytochrome P450 [Mycobacteriales bacterium]|nr:cytochrome P450 [Mycobacteriales bacterium]